MPIKKDHCKRKKLCPTPMNHTLKIIFPYFFGNPLESFKNLMGTPWEIFGSLVEISNTTTKHVHVRL
jgi:hypothetical protein